MIDAIMGIIAASGVAFGLFQRYERLRTELYCEHQRKPHRPTLAEERARMAKINGLRDGGMDIIEAIEKVGR